MSWAKSNLPNHTLPWNTDHFSTALSQELKMATPMTLSSGTTNPLLQPINLNHSSLTHPPTLSFPHQSFSFHRLITQRRGPATIICHAKLDGFNGEEPVDIGDIFFGENDLAEEESDEDETESSIDLLVRFLQSMFKKLSKRTKKASRSVLPSLISPQLVSFAVDGTLLLGVLSIAKALLEVVCGIGSSVFAAILLLRVIWATISYFQSNGNTFNQGGSSFGTSQPVL